MSVKGPRQQPECFRYFIAMLPLLVLPLRIGNANVRYNSRQAALTEKV